MRRSKCPRSPFGVPHPELAQNWPLAHPLPQRLYMIFRVLRRRAAPTQLWTALADSLESFRGWPAMFRLLLPSHLPSGSFPPCFLCSSPTRHILFPCYTLLSPLISPGAWSCSSPSPDCFTCSAPHITSLSFILTPSERPSLTPELGSVPLSHFYFIFPVSQHHCLLKLLLKCPFPLLNFKFPGSNDHIFCSLLYTLSLSQTAQGHIMITKVEDVNFILSIRYPRNAASIYCYASHNFWLWVTLVDCWEIQLGSTLGLLPHCGCVILLELFYLAFLSAEIILLKQLLSLSHPLLWCHEWDWKSLVRMNPSRSSEPTSYTIFHVKFLLNFILPWHTIFHSLKLISASLGAVSVIRGESYYSRTKDFTVSSLPL